eukprot:2729416-Rhodomonas_salina.1
MCPTAIHHATTSMRALGPGGSPVHPSSGYRQCSRRAVACGRGRVCAAVGWYAEGTKAVWRDSIII